MKRIKVVSVISSMLLLFSIVWSLETMKANASTFENLLTNGSFEDLTTNGAWKDNVAPANTSTWTASGSPVYAVDQEVSKSGSHAAKIEATEVSRGAVIQQTNEIEVGETYLISGWMKAEDVSNHGLVRFQITRTGTNTLVNIADISGTEDWTYFERKVTIPEGSSLMKVETFLENSTGSLWIDDLSVKRVVEVEELTIEPAYLSMDVGEETQLELHYTPRELPEEEQKVSWSSSNEEVIQVSDDGKLNALQSGYSFVTVESEARDVSHQIAVSVGESELLTVQPYEGTVSERYLTGQLEASHQDGNDLTFILAVAPEHGQVHVTNDGSFTYYPDEDYSGQDTFVYLVDSGDGGPKFATATIEVEAMEVAPELDLLWHAVEKNTTLEAQIEHVEVDDADNLVWEVDHPSHGEVTVSQDGSFSYTPDDGYTGFDSFDVAVETSTGLRSQGSITVFVLPDSQDLLREFDATKEHPRLFADNDRFSDIRSQIGEDRYLTEWYELLKEEVDQILETEPLAYSATGSNYGTLRNRLIRSSLMYQLSGDERYAERVVAEMEAISEYPDWFERNNNMLPLSEFTFGYALAYDWIYDYLTEEQQMRFADDIRENSLRVAREWYNGEFRHNGEYNNINLVNNGGFALAALTLMDKGEANEQAATDVLRGAYTKLQQTIRFYTDDGAWLEGPAYWHYGGQYLTYMMAAMQQVLGTDYGLSDLPGIAKSGEFPVYLLGEGGFFNFYDGNLSMAQPESMWYADHYNRADYAWHLGDLYRRKGVFDPLYLVFYKDGMFDTKPDSDRLDRTFTGIETISMRSGWDDPNALFAAMKGFNDTLLSHHDLDSGSFVFDALGERWALDLGNESYSIPGFWDYNNRRWTVYRKTAEGHNTLVVNPTERPIMQQQHDAKALLVDSDSKARGGYGVLDLTNRYPDALSMQRGLMMMNHRQEMLIQDEMEFLTPAEVYWFMHTEASIDIIEDGKAAILTQNDKRLYVKLLESPGDAVFQTMRAQPLPTSPNPDGQAINHGVQKLAVHMDDVKEGTLSIWMVPLWSNDELPTDAPAVTALKDWSIPDGELIEPPARPELGQLTIDGENLPEFNPSTTFYEYLVPIDQEQVPEVKAEANVDVNIIPAEQIPGETIIKVTDPNTEAVNQYTVSFVQGPIIGDLPEMNRLAVDAVTASAIPEPENGPNNTVDRSLDTRWSASGSQWIQYDLGEAKEVGAVSIAYMSGDARTYYLDIQASIDGENWTDLYTGQTSGLTEQPELFPVPETTARYIRINGQGNSSNNWNSITEVGIFQPAPIYLRLSVPEEIEVGETASITATWRYADGRIVETNDIQVESGNTDLLQVTKEKEVQGVAPGEGTVVVHDPVYGFETEATITVIPASIPQALLDELESLVEKASALDPELFTTETKEALITAIDEATTLLEKDDATKAAFEDAITALQQALDELAITYDGLMQLTDQFVDNKGITNALVSKLEAAKDAEDRGNEQAKDGKLKAYKNQVQALTGKKIKEEYAEVLLTWVDTL